MAKKTRPKTPGDVPRIESRKLNVLKDHPLQALFYADLDYDARVGELAADIQVRGLMEHIQILPKNSARLPANTIISGHCRRDALKLNGKTEFDVLVRYDLAEADAVDVEAEFLKENQLRRHQSKLSLAKVAQRLFEIEKGRSPGELCGWEQGEARDRVGKVLGMSGRNLQRYMSILETPIEVQRAFEAKMLGLNMTSRIARLPGCIQEEIAEQIQGGADAKSVVEKYLGKSSNHPKTLEAELNRYLRAIKEATERIGPCVKDIAFSPRPDELALLKRAMQMNDRLAKKLKANEKRNEEKSNKAMSKLLETTAKSS